ncbi:MAG: RNA polymerase sigma factor [Saprospiraceae bacterium]
MSDVEVINTYLHSQASVCFSLLYSRYSTKVFSKCLTLLKDEALAQDAMQEIFTKIFLNLSRFGGKSKFSTWVYSITYNFCIDFIRKNKKHNNLFSDEMEKTPDVVEEVEDHELLAMEVKQLKKVLDNIPSSDKAILLMKYQEEMSIREIATALDKTESAIKMKIKRAKAKAKIVKNELQNGLLVSTVYLLIQLLQYSFLVDLFTPSSITEMIN